MTSSFALNRNGNVYSWGAGQFGKIAQDDIKIQYREPRKIQFFENLGKEIVEIVAAPFHTLFLADDGDLYVCGNCKDGKLGTGNTWQDLI